MHAWLCTNPTGVDALAWTELPTPTPKAGKVLIEIKAADRKSTRLNSSHMSTSYAVFCLKNQHSAAAVVGGRRQQPPAVRQPECTRDLQYGHRPAYPLPCLFFFKGSGAPGPRLSSPAHGPSG